MEKETKNRLSQDFGTTSMVPEENIMSKIYLIRGYKVILDLDLATLYGMETKQLKRAVRRNIMRAFVQLNYPTILPGSEIPVVQAYSPETFRNLDTTYTPDHAALFSSTFPTDPDRLRQWKVFLVKNHLDQTIDLDVVMGKIRSWLFPIFEWLSKVQ